MALETFAADGRPAVQVILMGHRLGAASKQALRRLLGARAHIRIHYAPLQITRWDRVDVEMTSYLNQLSDQGCDVSGNTRTFFVPGGSSVSSVMFVAGWLGLTGKLPELLNVINQGPAVGYAPSPEKPVVDLTEYTLAHAATRGERPVAADAIIDLHSLKNRVGRAKRCEPRAHTVETL